MASSVGTINVLYSEEAIKARVKELAAEINRDYKDKAPLIIQVSIRPAGSWCH